MRRGCWHPHRGPTSYSSVRLKLPTAARSSYLNRRLCARRHRSQRLAQGAETVGLAHEAEQAGQRLSCAQHPCFCRHYIIPRLTRGRCCAANNTFRGLRSFVGTQDLAFVQYTTSEDWMYETPYHEELYDMTSDPYQCVPLTLRPDLSAWPAFAPLCDVQVGLLTIVCAQAVEYPRQG